jgi:hypothetical protein
MGIIMKDFYCFNTESEAIDCINAINGMSYFPLKVGTGQMIKWSNTPLVLKSSGYAVPRIPESLLNYAKIPQEDRESFLSVYGQDIRQLSPTDFVIEE